MKTRLASIAVAAICLAFALAPHAQGIAVANDDTMEKVLTAQVGKRVTVKLGSDNELTGTVKAVTPNLLQLSEIAGKEFFDAVVDLRSVQVIFVRIKR